MRDACVFKHTGKASVDKHGNATIAIKFEEVKELNFCVERQPKDLRSEYDRS